MMSELRSCNILMRVYSIKKVLVLLYPCGMFRPADYTRTFGGLCLEAPHWLEAVHQTEVECVDNRERMRGVKGREETLTS